MESILSLCSPADAFGALKDLYDRFICAPRDIHERAEHILRSARDFQRQLDQHANGYTISRELRDTTLTEPVRQLILPENNDPKRYSYATLGLAMRRDKHLKTLKEYKDNQLEVKLNGLILEVVQIREEVLNSAQYIENSHYIKPCMRDGIVKRLNVIFNNPTVSLDGLNQLELAKRQYTEISKSRIMDFIHHNSIQNNNLVTNADLFDAGNDLKFLVLLDISNALSHGKMNEWYHTRLSTKHIYVNERLFEDVDSLDSEKNIDEGGVFPFAKLVNFRCPVSTCCPNQCAHSKREYTKVNHVDYLMKESCANNAISFTLHIDHEMEQKDIDASSLASFLLWLYSGVSLRAHHFTDNPYEFSVVQLVPWQLRFIVTNALMKQYVPVEEVFYFLQRLKHKHQYHHQVHTIPQHVRSPLRDADLELKKIEDDDDVKKDESAEEKKYKSVMQKLHNETLLYSAKIGAITKDPRAAYFLGMEYEKKYIENPPSSNPDSVGSAFLSDITASENGPPSLRRAPIARHNTEINYLVMAYRSYAAAGYMGNKHAYIRMAYILAAWKSNVIPRPIGFPIDVSVPQMYKLLLAATLLNSTSAAVILEKLTTIENGWLLDAFKVTKDESVYNASEAEVKTRVRNIGLKIGKAWRHGTELVPRDFYEALQWFQLAKDDEEASLEIALLKVQWRRSVQEVQEATDVIDELAYKRIPMDECVQRRSQFWSAYWSYYGLRIVPLDGSDDTMVTVRKSARTMKEKATALQMAEWAARGKFVVSAMELVVKLRRAVGIPDNDRHCGNDCSERLLSDAKEGGGTMHSTESAKRKILQADELHMAFKKQKKRLTLPHAPFSLRNRSNSKVQQMNQDPTYAQALKICELLEEASNVWKVASLNVSTFSRNPAHCVNGARMIIERLDMWADWDIAVLSDWKSRDEFKTEKKQEVFDLLYRAIDMRKDENWKRLRMDFFHDDLAVMKEAEVMMNGLFGNWVRPIRRQRYPSSGQ